MLAMTALFVIASGLLGKSYVYGRWSYRRVIAQAFAYICGTYARPNGATRGVIVFASAFQLPSDGPKDMLKYHAPMSPYQIPFMPLCAGFAAAGGQFSITGAYRYAPARKSHLRLFADYLHNWQVIHVVSVPDIYSLSDMRL